jgi:hypothetical protein
MKGLCKKFYDTSKQRHDLVLLLLLALFSTKCFRHQSTLVVNLEAKDEIGSAIEGAEVFLDGRIMGFTDSRGKLSISREFYGAREMDLLIRKQNGTSYYSDFTHRIKLDGQAQEAFEISARMFHVEKQNAPFVQNQPPSSPSPDSPMQKLSPDAGLAIDQNTTTAEHSEQRMTEATRPVTAEIAKLNIVNIKQDGSIPIVRADADVREKFKHPERKRLSLNIYVDNGRSALANAQVRYLIEGDTEFAEGCKTNARGRCSLNLGVDSGTEVRLIVSSAGYLTQARQIRLTSKMKEKFVLREMNGVDYFALRPSYGGAHAISGVEVFIEGEKKGVTDRYGHFVLKLPPEIKPDSLVELRVQDLVPQKIEFEVSEAKSGVVTNAFRRALPELPRVALAPIKTVAALDRTSPEKNQKLAVLLKKNIFRRGLLQQRNFVEIERSAEFSDKTFGQLLATGWKGLRTNIDFVIEPVVVIGKPSSTIELRAIDPTGTMIAGSAAEINLEGSDHRQLDQQIAYLADRLFEGLPFELTIRTSNSSRISLGLHSKIKDLVRIGDILRIYGDSRKSSGETLQLVEKGTALVEKIDGLVIHAKISQRTESAEVRAGDFAKIGKSPGTTNEASSKEVVVTSALDKSAVDRASIYWNDRWIGTTDSNGRFRVPAGLSSGQLMVVDRHHHAFRSLANFAGNSRMSVALNNRVSFLQVDSEPRGAEVKLGDEILGKTPLNVTVPATMNQSVEIVVKGPTGYRDARQVFSGLIEDIDLTGSKRVSLEKDVLGAVRGMIESEQYQEAIARLESISESHSDYLFAQNEIGKIYLSKLSRPDLALVAFQRVTQSTAAGEFRDSRFTPTYLNQAVAYFMRGQSQLVIDAASALKEFRLAIELMQMVAQRSEDFVEDSREMAKHTIGFYTAMSAQRIAEFSGEDEDKKKSSLAWSHYAALVAQEPPTRDDTKEMKKVAEPYLAEKPTDSTTGGVHTTH